MGRATSLQPKTFNPIETPRGAGPRVRRLQRGAPVPPSPLRWTDLNVVISTIQSVRRSWADPDQPHDIGAAHTYQQPSMPCRRRRVRVAAQRTESSPTGLATRALLAGSLRRSLTHRPWGRPVSQGVSLMPASVAKRPVVPTTPGAAADRRARDRAHAPLAMWHRSVGRGETGHPHTTLWKVLTATACHGLRCDAGVSRAHGAPTAATSGHRRGRSRSAARRRA
jgi:hypothetical protein